MMKPTNITEARRYIANAKKILAENTTNDNYRYDDGKYVKMAGHTAYAGVLMALDPLMNKKASRLKIDDYKKALAKKNEKAVGYLNDIYEILHLYCGYDGNQSMGVFKEGVKFANLMIDWAEENLPQVEVSRSKTLGSVAKKVVKKKK